MERCKLRIAEIAILARSLAQQILMDLGLEPVWDQEHVYVPSSRVHGLKALVLQQRLQSPSLLQRRLHSTLLTPSHVLCLVAKRKQSRYCITRQAIILGEGGTALLLSELSMGTPSREDP
jgi:hypothetical protein